MAPIWLVSTAVGGGLVAGPLLERTGRRVSAGGGRPAPSGPSRLSILRRTPWSPAAFAGLTGALEGLVAWRFGAHWAGAAVMVFVAGLIALAWSDLLRLLLPKKILYPTLLLTTALLLAETGSNQQWHRFGTAGICGAVVFSIFLLPHLLNPAGLAFGDVRLAAGIGAVLGWFSVSCALEGLLIGTISGAVVAVGLLASGRAARSTRLPYGVFLAAGAIVALLVSGPGALG